MGLFWGLIEKMPTNIYKSAWQIVISQIVFFLFSLLFPWWKCQETHFPPTPPPTFYTSNDVLVSRREWGSGKMPRIPFLTQLCPVTSSQLLTPPHSYLMYFQEEWDTHSYQDNCHGQQLEKRPLQSLLSVCVGRGEGVCGGRVCDQISLENEDWKKAYGRYLCRISQGF